MLAYVHDNPRRAILKARVPQFMQSCLCLTIAGVRYSAFGNFLLLRRPLKAQVFCHRMARMGQLTLDERHRHRGQLPPCRADLRDGHRSHRAVVQGDWVSFTPPSSPQSPL
jgi:hypothetical protein